MKRISCAPRSNAREVVERDGLLWHETIDPATQQKIQYWDETAYYSFTLREIDAIEAATNELHAMCLRAAQEVIDQRLYGNFGIPTHMVPLIENAWEAEPPSLYGRFDLALAPNGSIKMLEYNADTPTSLLEAAVIQWVWFEETRYGTDQFNSIHDRLSETWKDFSGWIKTPIAFCAADAIEDGFTLSYLQETAIQAGYLAESFPITEMGWDGEEFVSGRSNQRLGAIFKLYPWEWLAHEQFAAHLPVSKAIWIEPVWKMLLSNKAILPVLWRLYPDHPLLLESTLHTPAGLEGWVRKPKMGREGANVTIFGKAETPGEYGEEGFIYQRDAQVPQFNGQYPIVGSWIIGQTASGIGIRESDTRITDNLSRFVPHVIRD